MCLEIGQQVNNNLFVHTVLSYETFCNSDYTFSSSMPLRTQGILVL